MCIILLQRASLYTFYTYTRYTLHCTRGYIGIMLRFIVYVVNESSVPTLCLLDGTKSNLYFFLFIYMTRMYVCRPKCVRPRSNDLYNIKVHANIPVYNIIQVDLNTIRKQPWTYTTITILATSKIWICLQ